MKHIPSHLQLADIFTKSIPAALFCSLRFKLGVDVLPTPSLRWVVKITESSSEGNTLSQPEVLTEAKKEKTLDQTEAFNDKASNTKMQCSINKMKTVCDQNKDRPIKPNTRKLLVQQPTALSLSPHKR